MEEIFLAVAQFCIELLFPLLVEIVVNVAADSWWLLPEQTPTFDRILPLVTVGGALGAASGAVPSPIQSHPVVQALVVLVGPWILAGGAEWFFRSRSAKNRPVLGAFWFVYWFALAFLLVRSVMLHRQTIHFWW
jgi:hypothetical protein